MTTTDRLQTTVAFVAGLRVHSDGCCCCVAESQGFWSSCAVTSRSFFQRAINPPTALCTHATHDRWLPLVHGLLLWFTGCSLAAGMVVLI